MRTHEWDFDPVNDPFDEAATEQFDRVPSVTKPAAKCRTENTEKGEEA